MYTKLVQSLRFRLDALCFSKQIDDIRLSTHLILIFIMLSSLFACTVSELSERKGENMDDGAALEDTFEDFVAIAVYGSTDKATEKIIVEALQAAGIQYILEGSVVYSVQVPQKDKMEAIKILKNSEALQDKWLEFVEE